MADGVSALDEVSSQVFDIALVDINLPDINGLELSQQLRKLVNHQHREMPIVAVSAQVLKEQVEGYLAAGFDGFIPKPVQMKKLQPMLAKVMGGISSPQAISTEPVKPAELSDANEEPLLIDPSVLQQDMLYLGEEKVARLISLFQEDSVTTMSDILATTDHSEQAALIHKLKGSAASLGLIRLQTSCAALEQQAKTEQLSLSLRQQLELLLQQSTKALENSVF